MTSQLDARSALVALSALPAIGPTRLRAMLAHHSPEDALARLVGSRPLHPTVGLRTDRPLFARLHTQATEVSPDEVLARCESARVAVVVAGDDEYPELLTCDQESPPVIYVRGDSAILGARRVGIVGTRNATAAGRATAHELGLALADNGVCVVSGLARGIDGAAHRGVRAGSGLAVGVVGNGLDWPYPKQNSDLWEWVGANGLLMSEWPPGTAPEAWRFPYRNRVIAALSEVLVVVESRVTGGSLITARAALDRDVDVMAVPGSVRNKAAEGTNRLLLEGAAPITCVDDVLVALALDHRRVAGNAYGRGEFDVGPGVAHADVLALCSERACTIDMLAMTLERALSDVAIAVSELERLGLVLDSAGWFEATGSRFADGPGGSKRWLT